MALAKEEDWEYELPEFEEPPATMTIGLDGTCMLLAEDGWREAMVGTIGFYDSDGERRHTIYIGGHARVRQAPFFDRLDREIDRVKAAYPSATYVGLADGAKENWLYLGPKTAVQVVDFYHATQYIWAAADPLFPRGRDRAAAVDRRVVPPAEARAGGGRGPIAELEARGAALGRKRLPAEVDAALTYFRNQVRAAGWTTPS